MVDFHSHILPGIDDGSRDSATSIQLLEMEKAQGVDTIVLTPHFYSMQNDPEKFLRRREVSWEHLEPKLQTGMPRLLLGAEVQYFEGINNVAELPLLCIEGTNLLLLEMPFFSWDSRVVNSVLDLQEAGSVQLVLAHIDRYIKMQSKSVWDEFRRFGVKMQVNTEFFEGFFGKRKAMSMLRAGEFQLIGSDCHNLTSRKPDWSPVPQEAIDAASKNFETLVASHSYSM